MSGTEIEAEEIQADFLFLRELGQGASSVRLSEPLSIENSESSVNLICVSNSNGLLFAAANEGFCAHKLSDIRQLCSTSSRKQITKVGSPLQSIRTIDNALLGAKVCFLRLAQNEEKVIAGLSNGRIAIWSVKELLQGVTEANVILQPPSAGLSLLEVAPNPSDRPELCIALYGTSDKQKLRSGTAIVFNLQSGQWGAELRTSSGASTTSLCWSVKGKQVVLGLDNGNLVQMTPEGLEKDSIPRPTGLEGTPYVEQVMWLENHVFFVTYNQPPNAGDDDPVHQYEIYTVIRDIATKSFSYTHFADPAAPFGDTARRGHRYTAWMKGWEPTKHMLFVANTSSTEVGLLGSMTKSNQWHNLDLEDTSRPTLPFSSIDSSADTCPVGLDLDVTSESNVDDPQAAIRGEDGKGKLSSMPILYVYTTDGMLLSYTVINVDPSAGKYPGMSIATVSKEAEPVAAESSMQTDTADIVTPSKPSTSTAAFTTTPTSSGLTPGFGQSSGFGSFGGAPAFGQSASIGNNSPSPFSFNSSASAPSNATPSSMPAASTGGFGAFSSKPSNAFGSGSTSFSFGTPQNTSTSTHSPAASAAAPSPAFGSSSNTSSTSAFGAGSKSAFGQVSATPAFGSSSAFGASATGPTTTAFGQPSAFGSASTSQKSPFATASGSNNAFSTSSTSSSSGFGGFASKASTFGPSANNDSNQSGSIFGSGGSLQSKDTTKLAPVFGQSTNQTSSSLFASNATVGTKDEVGMEEEKGDAGSLSFGGLGGLLGESQDEQTKASGFTFGSKQDATFSKTPTPSPFSFTKPKEVESKQPEKEATIPLPSKDAGSESSKKAGEEAPKPISAFGASSAFPTFTSTTTPTTSPQKAIPNGRVIEPAVMSSAKVEVKKEREDIPLSKPGDFSAENIEAETPAEDASSEVEGDEDDIDGEMAEEGEDEEDEEEEVEEEDQEEEEEEVALAEKSVHPERQKPDNAEVKAEEKTVEKEEEKGKTAPQVDKLQKPAKQAPTLANKEMMKPPEPSRAALPSKVADPDELVKGSLQDLFLQTFLTMEKELTVLKENTLKGREHQATLKRTNEEISTLNDLSNETKWSFGDLETKSRLCQNLMASLDRLGLSSQSVKLRLKEIQSSQLKSDIKREEIARFIRARNDPSLSRLVRIRQLGPEHADNQAKLRRAISTVREGIEELEGFIDKARKVALDERGGIGHSTLRAPSLDTIRRTARNITQSAQIRLIELQELEMSYEQLTMSKPGLSRNFEGNSIVIEDEEDHTSNVFDSIRSMERALPRSDNGRSQLHKASQEDALADRGRDLRSKNLELKSVFLSGWKEPILNKPKKIQDIGSEGFQLSDLNMAFAKGPIRVSTSKPALKSPPLKLAPAQNGDSKADSPTFSFFTKSTTNGDVKKKAEAPTFFFSTVPSSTLPKDAFQLPPEQAPFAPGGNADHSSRSHHVSKYGGKRNTAVALPNSQLTSTNDDAKTSKTDFFAMPETSQAAKSANQSTKMSSPISAFNTATSSTTKTTPFTSFGSLGFGNNHLKNTKPSTPFPLASRLGPVTFQGLQPMKPIASASQVGTMNDDDNSSGEDNVEKVSDDGHAEVAEGEGEEEENDGEDDDDEGEDDDYGERYGDGEEEGEGEDYRDEYGDEMGGDQEGLSDVEEAEEE